MRTLHFFVDFRHFFHVVSNVTAKVVRLENLRVGSVAHDPPLDLAQAADPHAQYQSAAWQLVDVLAGVPPPFPDPARLILVKLYDDILRLGAALRLGIPSTGRRPEKNSGEIRNVDDKRLCDLMRADKKISWLASCVAVSD